MLFSGLVPSTSYAQDSPPVEEIKAIVAKNALWPPTSVGLAFLNAANLDEGLKAIDPYARYIPPSASSKDSKQSLGIELIMQDFSLWIRPDPTGPADRAGVPEIGLLLAVNGKDMTGRDLTVAASALDTAIKKKEVELVVAAKKEEPGKAYKVIPGNFSSRSFTWRRKGNCMAIRIKEFSARDTAPGIQALYKTMVSGQSKVVFDLRGCSGGDLPEAIELAGMFVPAGALLLETYDRSGKGHVYKSPGGLKLPIPRAVLIDGVTASAAEVFAGILSHYRLAKLVGLRSFGKAVSQTFYKLSDGGGLWVTNHALKLPDGKPDLKAGLRPDIFRDDIVEITLNSLYLFTE
jgi:carboxyl-terminal processing protease